MHYLAIILFKSFGRDVLFFQIHELLVFNKCWLGQCIWKKKTTFDYKVQNDGSFNQYCCQYMESYWFDAASVTETTRFFG